MIMSYDVTDSEISFEYSNYFLSHIKGFCHQFNSFVTFYNYFRLFFNLFCHVFDMFCHRFKCAFLFFATFTPIFVGTCIMTSISVVRFVVIYSGSTKNKSFSRYEEKSKWILEVMRAINDFYNSCLLFFNNSCFNNNFRAININLKAWIIKL